MGIEGIFLLLSDLGFQQEVCPQTTGSAPVEDSFTRPVGIPKTPGAKSKPPPILTPAPCVCF